MKIALKIVLTLLAVIVLCGVGLVLLLQSAANDTVTKDDGVAQGYYEKIDYTEPLEAKYADLGPHSVQHITLPSESATTGEFHIFVPNSEPTIPKPLVVMVNGTNTPASTYLPVLEHLASWGFVVIGNEDLQSGSGESTSETLDFALTQNDTPESPIYQRIDPAHIGIMGHSQGGAGAINAATNYPNSNKYTSFYTASGISHFIAKQNSGDYDISKLSIPAFLISSTGGEDRFFVSSHKALKANFNDIKSGKPTIKARRIDVDHKDVLEYADPYMTAWFLWTLSNDPTAKEVFSGANPELASNPTWQDFETKNL